MQKGDKMKKEYLNMNANEIRKALITSGEKYNSSGAKHCLCDIACLFVAAAFLLSSEDVRNKDIFRKEAYIAFLKNNRNVHIKAWNMIDCITKGANTNINNKIRVLKGGSYKIASYYLENYKLQDIRGASALLTYVEESVIPTIISDKFIPECIIYSGGGNIFAIVPEECDDKFALELEEKAREILISANIAFNLSKPQPLKDFFNKNYKSKMFDIERRLDERKKLKVFIPESPKTDLGLTLKIDGLDANNPNKQICIGKCFDEINECEPFRECDSCKRRRALYVDKYYRKDDAEVTGLCASCLHKREVGRRVKSKFHDLFTKYNKKEPRLCSELSDIDKEHIAIIYGDGNNIGGVIERFQHITDMMEFSRNIKEIVEKIVFTAMKEVNIDKFEVVGLGGDDIFIILEGKKAISYATKLIELYNKEFKNYIGKDSSQKSTLSVGIAISETKMPIQILLEEAEIQLKRAKEVAKQQGKNDDGSLSYIILNAFKDDESSRDLGQDKVKNTLLPYTHKIATDVLKFAEKMKKVDNSRLRNILDAFENAQSTKEANLYLEYMNAKHEENVDLDEIDSYELYGGYYYRGGTYYYIWRDLIYLLKFCE